MNDYNRIVIKNIRKKMDKFSKDVLYYFDESIGTYNYGNHPMKPFRIAMTDNLIKSYGID